MSSYLYKGHHSLLELEVSPPLLDSEGGSPLDYHIDGILL